MQHRTLWTPEGRTRWVGSRGAAANLLEECRHIRLGGEVDGLSGLPLVHHELHSVRNGIIACRRRANRARWVRCMLYTVWCTLLRAMLPSPVCVPACTAPGHAAADSHKWDALHWSGRVWCTHLQLECLEHVLQLLLDEGADQVPRQHDLCCEPTHIACMQCDMRQSARAS